MKKTSPGLAAALAAAALCALVALPTTAARQKKEEKQQAAEQPLTVRLNALVLEAQDRLADGLRAEDFQLFEDGAPQKISGVAKQEGPHAFGLVVDSTGSMRTDIDRVVAFGKMISRGVGAESEGFVVSFVSSDEIKVIQDMTADKASLESALESIFIRGGQTAINDAVYLSAERLERYRRGQTAPRRYSLVLFTDGEDRASYYKDEQVWKRLRESGARVFVVGFMPKRYEKTTPEKAKQYMSRLAFESGGSAYFITKGVDPAQVARQVLTDMSANYVISYDSTNARRDGSARLIRLSAGAGPDGAARRVFVTEGYTAPKDKPQKK